MIDSNKKYKSNAIKYKEEEASSLQFFENQIGGNNPLPFPALYCLGLSFETFRLYTA